MCHELCAIEVLDGNMILILELKMISCQSYPLFNNHPIAKIIEPKMFSSFRQYHFEHRKDRDLDSQVIECLHSMHLSFVFNLIWSSMT